MGRHIFHVRPKEIRAAGGHAVVGSGEGVLPLGGNLCALQWSGRAGVDNVQHEPEDHEGGGPERAAALRLLTG